MKCNRCGTDNDADARFCKKCGSDLAGKTVQPDSDQKAKSGGFYRFCLAAAAIWTFFMAGSLLAMGISLVNHGVIDPTVFGLGFGLGFALLVVRWFIGTVVLLLLALATRPKISAPWPRVTQLTTASLSILALFWPVVKATTLPSSQKAVSSSISPISGVGISATGAGEWHVNEERSAMDGSKTVTVFREAENDVQGWLDAKKPTLLVRCKENQTDVYVATGMAASVEYGTDTHTVRLRLDDGGPITQHWSESTGNDALFAPNAVQLATRMANAKTLAFEFTPFNANPAVVRFNLDGLRPHLDTVASTCGWQMGVETAREAARQTAAKLEAAREAEREIEGAADVISWPQGASVSIDGEMIDGSTPFRVPLDPGTHPIEITKDGYQTWTGQVLIKTGETAHIEVTLTKEQK